METLTLYTMPILDFLLYFDIKVRNNQSQNSIFAKKLIVKLKSMKQIILLLGLIAFSLNLNGQSNYWSEAEFQIQESDILLRITKTITQYFLFVIFSNFFSS